MSTLDWSDAKRRRNVRVDQLRWQRYKLEQRHRELLSAYINAAMIADPAERRRVRADTGARLQAVGRELNDVKAQYYRESASLRGMA